MSAAESLRDLLFSFVRIFGEELHSSSSANAAENESCMSSSIDPVNHPPHYTQYPIEVIEIAERLNFCLGNVVKYVLRADFKGRPLEDLRKAKWYLEREISRREKESPS